MATRSEMRSEIQELGLPEIVLEIFDGQSDDDTLGFYCKDPYFCLQPGAGLPSHYLPLWECGVVTTAFNKQTKGYSVVSLEQVDEPFVDSVSFRELFEKLFTSMWEGEEPDEYLKYIASRFEYDEIENLMAKLKREKLN